MHKTTAQEVLPKKRCSEEEVWEYLDDKTLKKSRSAHVCMTCIHFSYSCDKHCHTSLTCRAHHCLIPQGAHLKSRCTLWHGSLEYQSGPIPKAA